MLAISQVSMMCSNEGHNSVSKMGGKSEGKNLVLVTLDSKVIFVGGNMAIKKKKTPMFLYQNWHRHV